MSTSSAIFSRVVLREQVKITPREIGSNVRDIILVKLKNRLEGVCSRHGYVRQGSLKIVDLSAGRIEGSSLNGDAVYSVAVAAEVCNPAAGHVVPARIVNSNKFGLLAHSGFEIDGNFIVILDIFITRRNYHGGSTEVPVDSVQVGDDVFVEVLGKTFELNDVRISVAGRLLRAVSPGAAKMMALNTVPINGDSDVDEESPEQLNDRRGAARSSRQAAEEVDDGGSAVEDSADSAGDGESDRDDGDSDGNDEQKSDDNEDVDESDDGDKNDNEDSQEGGSDNDELDADEDDELDADDTDLYDDGLDGDGDDDDDQTYSKAEE